MSDHRLARVHLECFHWEDPDMPLETWPIWLDIVVDGESRPVNVPGRHHLGEHQYHDDREGRPTSPVVPVLLRCTDDPSECELDKFIRKKIGQRDGSGNLIVGNDIRVDRYYFRNFMNNQLNVQRYKKIEKASSNAKEREKLRAKISEQFPYAVTLMDRGDEGNVGQHYRSYYQIVGFEIRAFPI